MRPACTFLRSAPSARGARSRKSAVTAAECSRCRSASRWKAKSHRVSPATRTKSVVSRGEIWRRASAEPHPSGTTMSSARSGLDEPAWPAWYLARKPAIAGCVASVPMTNTCHTQGGVCAEPCGGAALDWAQPRDIGAQSVATISARASVNPAARSSISSWSESSGRFASESSGRGVRSVRG